MSKTKKVWRKYGAYYILLLPAMIYLFIYKYLPMFGLIIAFKDVAPFDGIAGMITAPWVGLKHFKLFMSSPFFGQVMGNTIKISLYNLLFGFPAPIILSLLINEIGNKYFKKGFQTLSYLPHFLSVIIVAGMVANILNPTSGIVNQIIMKMGGEPIFFLGDNTWIRKVIVGSGIWQEVGWNSIIYLAAITGVPTELYEAATIDGATRFQRVMHITIPCIMFTVSIMFIMQMGKVLDAGFERVLSLYSPSVYKCSDIIDTYVYRAGLVDLKYSFSAAVGLFKSVVGLAMVILANYCTKKMGQEGLW